jgi:hypothetical protein
MSSREEYSSGAEDI